MSRIFRRWSRYLLPAILFLGAGGAVFASLLLSHHPLSAITTDFDGSHPIRFLSPWPLSPLQQELHDKKKKRLPKNEMQRVYDLDMRRMEYINAPVFDLFMNDKLKHLNGDFVHRTLGFGEFPWPWLETLRPFGDGTGPQKISYISIPTSYGLSLHEGVMLAPGEEIEFAFPVTKLRRSLRFHVLPLNTGTLRISLGQYAWARTFAESDLNKVQFFSVPVNDAAAMVAKISANSARVFLTQARISQSEMSGRVPIQVAQESSIWAFNPKFLRADMSGEIAVGGDDSPDDSLDASSRLETARPDETDALSTAPVSGEATPQATTNTSPAAPSSLPVVPASSSQNSASAGDGTKEVPLDSLFVTENPQVSVPGASTVALGYNVMVLHLPSISQAILNDEKKLKKIAPNISEFLSKSVAFEMPKDTTPVRAFRSLVLGDAFPRFFGESQILLRDALERMNGVNLYRHARDFGYQVFSLAPAQVLGFSKPISWMNDGPLFSERTLDSNDFDFAKKRVKVDRDAQPATGLEAVFKTKEVTLQPPLVTSDYVAVSKYFEKLSGDLETFPDWRANEIFVPDDRDAYMATAVHQFQNWTNLNRQVRLFGHVWLGGGAGFERPSLKDFLRGLASVGISHIPSEVLHGDAAQLALADRAFGQIRDVAKARRITHRTVWLVMIPVGEGMTARLEIPGLLKKDFTAQHNLSMDDLRATLLSSVGVPMELIDGLSNSRIAGKSVEAPVLGNAQSAPQISSGAAAYSRLDKFVLRIAPSKTGCAPFVWRSRKPILGLSASAPVFELAKSRMEFTVYPCAVPVSWVSLDWFQNMEQVQGLPGETQQEALQRLIGGEIVFAPLSEADKPLMYFGEGMRRLNNPIFSFTMVTPSEVESIFSRPWSGGSSELSSTLQKLDASRRSLFPIERRNVTQVFFAREKSQ